jgi:DNA topoisomerase
MAPAITEKTKAEILISNSSEVKFIASGEVIKFDGFLKVYMESSDEDEEETAGMLPKIQTGENLTPSSILISQKFKQHPPRYTEASLVKKLEEQGIGRPSTYAPTISTILKRGYVLLEDRPGTKRKYLEFTLQDGQITRDEREQTT